jgi:hypothetical protein
MGNIFEDKLRAGSGQMVLGLGWVKLQNFGPCRPVDYGTRLPSVGSCVASPIGAVSSTQKRDLENWATVMEQSVFQHVP